MKVKDIVDILKCQVLNEGDMEEEVKTACGSDMMSDVLAFVKDQSVLLTGLMNPQVVRTAEMMDMHCIVFVRGKKVDPNVVALALTGIGMIHSPGLLFTESYSPNLGFVAVYCVLIVGFLVLHLIKFNQKAHQADLEAEKAAALAAAKQE